jgi:DNA-binding transcriptional ArsR family regulator
VIFLGSHSEPIPGIMTHDGFINPSNERMSRAMRSDSQRPLYEVKANLFKGLAHPLRVRVLEVLSAAPEASVSELLDATGLEASHLSQHLAVLKRNLLVVGERRGNQVYYRLAYPQVADLLRVARALLGEILETTERQLVERAGLPEIPPAASMTATAAAP